MATRSPPRPNSMPARLPPATASAIAASSNGGGGGGGGGSGPASPAVAPPAAPTRPSGTSAASINHWLFTEDELDASPSLGAGYTRRELDRRLRAGCTFQRQIAQALELKQKCPAASHIYLYRFYQLQSVHNFKNIYDMAAAALLLATKVMENIRGIDWILVFASKLLPLAADAKPSAFWSRYPGDVTREILREFTRTPEYAKMRNDIINNERKLLYHLYYDIGLDLGYNHLFEKGVLYQNRIEERTQATSDPVELERLQAQKAQFNQFVQHSWTFLNDGMTTSLVLRFTSRQLAEACLKLASEFMGKQYNDVVDADLARSEASNEADRNQIMEFILQTLEDQTPATPGFGTPRLGPAAAPASGPPGNGSADGAGAPPAPLSAESTSTPGAGPPLSLPAALGGEEGRKKKRMLSEYQSLRTATPATSAPRDSESGSTALAAAAPIAHEREGGSATAAIPAVDAPPSLGSNAAQPAPPGSSAVAAFAAPALPPTDLGPGIEEGEI